MSELGKTVSELVRAGLYKAKALDTQKVPIGIKTPLEKGSGISGETLFKMHYEIKDQIVDNLKNLILTQKGERFGFPDYGTDLRSIYSNPHLTPEQAGEVASSEVKTVIEKYMPSIRLEEFYSERVDLENINTLENYKEDPNNITGFLHIDSQNNNIQTKKPIVKELNKDNPNLKSVYKVHINFTINIINANETLKLFVNSSK